MPVSNRAERMDGVVPEVVLLHPSARRSHGTSTTLAKPLRPDDRPKDPNQESQERPTLFIQPLRAGLPPILLLFFPIAAVIAYIAVPPSNTPIEPHRYQSFTVSRVEHLSDSVKLVEIALADERSRKLFTTPEEDDSWRKWETSAGNTNNAGAPPGDVRVQHIYIKSPDLQIERPYTPINDVAQDGKLILLVKRVKGGEVGRYIHTLAAGSRVELRGPVQTCVVPLSAFDHLDIISTGTGGAPFSQLVAKLSSRARTRHSRAPALTLNPTTTSTRITNPQITTPSIRWTQYLSKDSKDTFARAFPIPEGRVGVSRDSESRGPSEARLTDGQRGINPAESRVVKMLGDIVALDPDTMGQLGLDVRVERAWPDETPKRDLVLGCAAGGHSGVMLCLPPVMTTAWAGTQMPVGRPPVPPPIRGVLGELGYTREQVLIL